MGKTKIATIDDSQPEVEVKSKKSKVKSPKEEAKSSESEATGAVERISEPNESTPEQGAKRTHSESTKETSGASRAEPDSVRADERAIQKKTQKPGKAKPRSKKYQEAIKDLDRSKTYPIPEAVEMVKKLSYSKFNGTLEAHINTAQTGIRGLVSLPFSSGKKLRILVFGAKTPIEDTTPGDDSAIESISKGKVDFDLVITTPEWMPKLAKVAKVLGPKGLMPNPKNGTITSPSADGLKKAVESFQAGKTEFKTESKAAVIHLGLGKLNQPTAELSANIKTLLQTIGKTKVKQARLAPTMGPSVKIELSNAFA